MREYAIQFAQASNAVVPASAVSLPKEVIRILTARNRRAGRGFGFSLFLFGYPQEKILKTYWKIMFIRQQVVKFFRNESYFSASSIFIFSIFIKLCIDILETYHDETEF